jgi:hypothetical protein
MHRCAVLRCPTACTIGVWWQHAVDVIGPCLFSLVVAGKVVAIVVYRNTKRGASR